MKHCCGRARGYGWILFQTGKTEQAARLLTRAAQFSPGMPIVHYHLGAVLAEQGQDEPAEQALREALVDTGGEPWAGDVPVRLNQVGAGE